jgi:hypothetical protein
LPVEAATPSPFAEGYGHHTSPNATASSWEKKQGGDLSCPSWISMAIRKLIGRLLDPNPPPEESCKPMMGARADNHHWFDSLVPNLVTTSSATPHYLRASTFASPQCWATSSSSLFFYHPSCSWSRVPELMCNDFLTIILFLDRRMYLKTLFIIIFIILCVWIRIRGICEFHTIH